MLIITERSDDSDAPWTYEIFDKRGRFVSFNGWFRSEDEAIADANAWLADQSLLSAAL